MKCDEGTLNSRGPHTQLLDISHGIEAQPPDDFLLQLYDLQPQRIVALVQRQAAALLKPPMTFNDVLKQIGNQAPRFAVRLRTDTDSNQ